VIMRHASRALLAAVAGAALLLPAAAGAQDEPGPYDPLGIRAGAFLVYPQVSVDVTYDDNVFATRDDKEDDVIFRVRPEVAINSDWTRHRLNAGVGGELGFHVDESDENFQNAFAFTSGRLDVRRNSFAEGLLRYDRRTETRDEPEDIGDRRKRTAYHVGTARLGYTHRFNRIELSGAGQARILDFRDVFGVGGDRDRWEYSVIGRAGFAVSPRILLFTRGTYDWIRYDDRFDRAGFERDNDGFSVAGGVRLDITALLDGEVYGGYRRQRFDDARFDTQDGVSFGGSLRWLPTALTTVRLSLARDLQTTTQDGSAGNFRTDINLGVDHDIRRNIRLSADAGFRQNDFRGIDRKDDIIELGAGVRYLLNRNLSVNANYTFTDRDSNVDVRDFRRHVVRVGVTGRL
jgi:hypothetical protein